MIGGYHVDLEPELHDLLDLGLDELPEGHEDIGIVVHNGVVELELRVAGKELVVEPGG